MPRLLQLLLYIRYSLWFIPSVIVGAAILLAIGAVELDAHVGEEVLSQWPRLFGSSADGARAILQAVAGAMITVAGLTFSITVLVLSMGASQYTPRVIRTFMGNRSTQTVLGIFVGIFCYCLVVLRAVRGTDEEFIPSVAVTIAMLLALVGVGVLVYFIHHMATSIQVSAIVSAVTDETVRMIDATYAQPNRDADNDMPAPPAVRAWSGINALRTGYLRTVDADGLADYARTHDMLIRLERKIGDFVIERGPLLMVSRPPHDGMENDLNRFFTVGHFRTVEQDVGVGIQQLVDIALRALSPGVNDTSTALLCIDYLAAIFSRLAPVRIVPQHCYLEQKLRVMQCGMDFHHILASAFDQIRVSGQGSFPVYLRLLDALHAIAFHASGARRAFILSQVRRLQSESGRLLGAATQAGTLERRIQQVLAHWECAPEKKQSQKADGNA